MVRSFLRPLIPAISRGIDTVKKILSKFFDKTFLKFIAVGVANTLFGSAIMFGLYNLLHVNYWISSAANYVFGSVLSYFLNKTFTFGYKETNASVIIRFIVNITICYFLAYGLAKPFVRMILSNSSLSIQENLSMLVGMGAFVVFNYIGQRFWTFKQR